MLFINDLWFKHLMLAIEEEQEEEDWKEQEEKQEIRTRRSWTRSSGFNFQIEFAMNFCECIFV